MATRINPTTKRGTIGTFAPETDFPPDSFLLRRERITMIGASRHTLSSLKTIADETDHEPNTDAVAKTWPTSCTAAPAHDPNARSVR